MGSINIYIIILSGGRQFLNTFEGVGEQMILRGLAGIIILRGLVDTFKIIIMRGIAF